MPRSNSITKRLSPWLLLLGLLTVSSLSLAATYNLSNGQRPFCSTSWAVSGTDFRCINNGRISLGPGDVVIANSPARLLANDGFALGNASVGTATNPIALLSTYGDITANGATLFGDVEAASGAIDLTNTQVSGDLLTGGDIELSGGRIEGDVTSQNNRISANGTQFQGQVQANGDISLTDSSVEGPVISTNNRIIADGSDLLGGAQAQGDIRITDGVISGDVTSTNNRLYLTEVVMTDGNLAGGEIVITNSSLGGSTGVVNANAYYGSIDLINSSVVYGDLTAPSWSTINVSPDSQVFGDCTPLSPGCINRPPLSCPLAPGLTGDYFANNDLSAPAAFSQVDSRVNFDWGNGSPRLSVLGRDDFSIRWSGYLRAPGDAPFRIGVRSDDGVRLRVDEFTVIDNWTHHGPTLDQAELDLSANQYYRLELDYYEANGGALIQLLWDITDDGVANFTPIPAQYLAHCNALLPTPVLEWRMDQPSWNGSSGEVIDTSGNGNHGTGGGNLSTTASFLCRGGEFDGVDDFIRLPALYAALSRSASLSFWIRTTATGNNTPYLAPGISGVEQAGGADDIFWGWLDANGHIGLSVGNNTNGKSKQAINDGDYHHVVLIRDASTGDYRIYIDGKLDTNGRQAAGVIGNYFESLGRVENTAGGPSYFQGELDEVLVFSQMLGNGDVKLLYDLQRQGKNLDGSDRDLSNCGGDAQFCVSDNFSGPLDASQWQVSGTGFTPRNRGGRLQLTNDDTQVSTAATLLQQFPSAGNRIQVEFDFYAYTNAGSSNAADGIAIVLSNANRTPVAGGYGGSLGYAQNSNAGKDGFQGGWIGVGLDEFGNFANATEGRQGGVGQRPNAVSLRGSGDGTSGYAYLAGTAANLSPPILTGRNSAQRYRLTVDHSNGSQALVTVERDANQDGTFDRLIGPINVLEQPGQSAVPARLLLTLTGSTGAYSANHEIDNLDVCASSAEPYKPAIHHFELVRNRATGLTCEPLSVAVRACVDAACDVEYNDTFELTLAASGAASRSVNGRDLNSGDRLNLWLDSAGQYQLAVANSTPAATAPEALRCFNNTIAQPDCRLTMSDTGLRFFDTDDTSQTSLAVLDLVAGSQGRFSLQAVETNQSTGVCEGIFADGETLTFSAGSQCSDPETCLPDERLVLSQLGTQTELPNPQDTNSGNERTAVELRFGANSVADFELMAPDVGLQPLTLRFELQDTDSEPATITVVNQRIDVRARPAALKLVAIAGSKRTLDDTETLAELLAGEAFAEAGEPFRLALEGVDALGQPTANFGRTSQGPSVDWTASLLAPAGGVTGTITAATTDSQWQAGSISSRFETVTGLSYSEVGAINLSGTLNDYLPISGAAVHNINSDTRAIGRFVPHRLRIQQIGLVNWGDLAYRYQGQPADLTGLQLSVVAEDLNDQALANYDGDLFKLDLARPGLLERQDQHSATGAALQYNSNALTWDRQDSIDFNASTPAQWRLADLELIWPRKSAAPDSADTPTTINALQLPASALTDSDGVCFDNNGDGSCDGLDIALDPVSLRYGRLNADARASGTANQLSLPVWSETLTEVDPSLTDPWVFEPFSADSQTSATEVPSLIADGQCRIDGNASPQTICALIAASANGALIGLEDGRGYIQVDAGGETGVVGVRVEVPNWLSWDWDSSDTDTTQTGPASLLFFGQYTGRPPLLFQSPGFR